MAQSKRPTGFGSPTSEEEREAIVRAALYFGPRYHQKGRWQLKGETKFAEVKRLVGSARSAKALASIFSRWYEKNSAEWESMRKEAEKDWDAYFAEEIAQESGSQAAGSSAVGKAQTRVSKRRLSAVQKVTSVKMKPAEVKDVKPTVPSSVPSSSAAGDHIKGGEEMKAVVNKRLRPPIIGAVLKTCGAIERNSSKKDEASANGADPLPTKPTLSPPKRSHGQKETAGEGIGSSEQLRQQSTAYPPPAPRPPTGWGATSGAGTQIYCYGPVNHYYGPVKVDKEEE